ncbi:MAG: sugar transporter ATP-binding protein [Ilumatobacteraceae bacterium]|nr:sugar transporter ATP-binding protein [Ilumatobacteraceae bacterium]
MARIQLDKLDKVYDNGFQSIHDLDLDVADGEFLVLVGPSGCGKSTALRMIAGLESITGGTLRIGDVVVNDLPSKDRDIAMVFQSYALYPHLTVRENIAFPLRLRKVPKAEIKRRVDDAVKLLELEDYVDRKPANLSGGQRQRVAMGRAIVRQPAAFLMDEPLSNLDAKLRVQMRSEIAKLQRSLKVTTVYVTHDQVEAMTMGDRVAVLSRGTLQQVDTPQNLYDRPDNLFVAAFIGSPQMNLLEGTFQLDGDSAKVHFGSQWLNVPAAVLDAAPRLRTYAGAQVGVGIRPETMHDTALGGDNSSTIRGIVELREGLGSEIVVHMRVDASSVRPADVDDLSEGLGSLFVARVDPRSKVRIGDEIELGVATDLLHFFDLETTLAIRD